MTSKKDLHVLHSLFNILRVEEITRTWHGIVAEADKKQSRHEYTLGKIRPSVKGLSGNPV